MSKVSIREFARQLGVNEATVRKAIKTGRIAEGVSRDELGRPTIIPDVALSEWGRTYDPSYQRSPALHARLDQAAKAENPEPADAPVQTGRSTADLKRMLSEVRLQKEAIELRKMKGELVEKRAVYGTLFSFGQEVRAGFETIPDRTIDAILAARSRAEAHEVLVVAIAEALDTMATIISRDK